MGTVVGIGWVVLLMVLVWRRVRGDFGPIPPYNPGLAARQEAERLAAMSPYYRVFELARRAKRVNTGSVRRSLGLLP